MSGYAGQEEPCAEVGFHKGDLSLTREQFDDFSGLRDAGEPVASELLRGRVISIVDIGNRIVASVIPGVDIQRIIADRIHRSRDVATYGRISLHSIGF